MIKRAIGESDEGDTLGKSKQIIYVLIVVAAMLWLIPVLFGINISDTANTNSYNAHAQGLIRCDQAGAGEYVGTLNGVRHCQPGIDDNTGNGITQTLRDVESTIQTSVIIIIDILKYVVTAAALGIVVVLRVR